MNYGEENGIFSGELPDGDITHDEDEFFDAWAEEYFEEYLPWEDWI